MSFPLRIAACIAFLAIASAIELALRRGRATRWRSSLALVACGVLGALLGASIDIATSSLGPAYFAVGKGLGAGPGLTSRALGLGLQAGTGAGVLAGAVLLVAARRPPLPREVARAFASIAAHAGAGLALGAVAGNVLPRHWVADAGFEVAALEQRGFLVAWASHAAVYTFALIGTVRASRRLRAARAGPPP